jgi:hypothetical protein
MLFDLNADGTFGYIDWIAAMFEPIAESNERIDMEAVDRLFPEAVYGGTNARMIDAGDGTAHIAKRLAFSDFLTITESDVIGFHVTLDVSRTLGFVDGLGALFEARQDCVRKSSKCERPEFERDGVFNPADDLFLMSQPPSGVVEVMK